MSLELGLDWGTMRVSGACSTPDKLKVKAIAVAARAAMEWGRWLCFLGDWAKACPRDRTAAEKYSRCP